MRKIILDFNGAGTPEEVQDRLAEAFAFPDYYGKNLDALYDELTTLMTDTCAGFFAPGDGPVEEYLERVRTVMRDAEEENGHFAVIFGDLLQNMPYDYDEEAEM